MIWKVDNLELYNKKYRSKILCDGVVVGRLYRLTKEQAEDLKTLLECEQK